MIIAFYGSDRARLLKGHHALVESLRTKRPDAAVEQMTAEVFDSGALLEFAGRRGLFAPKSVMSLYGVLGNSETYDTAKGLLPELAESENVFVFLEGVLTKEKSTRLSKYAEKVEVHDLRTVPQALPAPSLFSLGDAFLLKDRARLWGGVVSALRRGVSPEEIAGVLSWQVRALVAVFRTGNAKESGLKPFVYTKTLRARERFTEAEVVKLSSALIAGYHEARRGGVPLEVVLERFALTV